MTPLALPPITRRELLRHLAGGFGTVGLAGTLAGGRALAVPDPALNPLAERPGHFAARAKRVIFLFMNGGPSHVDTFDPKPGLARHDGQDPPAASAAGAGRRPGGK